jgi:hypothetical protein
MSCLGRFRKPKTITDKKVMLVISNLKISELEAVLNFVKELREKSR